MCVLQLRAGGKASEGHGNEGRGFGCAVVILLEKPQKSCTQDANEIICKGFSDVGSGENQPI